MSEDHSKHVVARGEAETVPMVLPLREMRPGDMIFGKVVHLIEHGNATISVYFADGSKRTYARDAVVLVEREACPTEEPMALVESEESTGEGV